MVALAELAGDLMGSGPVVFGAACTPGTGLTVSVAPARIYAIESLEATAWSSLPADTTDQILKQGINLAATVLSAPAPGTAGQSIDYLIEGQYQDFDTNNLTLSYYNSSNPSAPFSGAGNNGIAQPTTRAGIFALQVKAGTAATTGTQVPPSADAGWLPLYVVTVANGAVSIVSGNISVASGAPVFYTPGNLLAPLISPTFTGTPAAPTPVSTDNTTKLATTAFVNSFANPGNSLAAHGYQKFAGGLIVQWGQDTMIASSPGTTITFPLAFPNACFSVLLVAYGGAATTEVLSQSATSFAGINGAGTANNWIAVGH